MNVVIGVADCYISTDTSNVLVTYALGSCIAVAIYDPIARVGGLLHFMLPEAPAGAAQSGKSPYMFADSGIPMMFREAYEKGAQKRRLRVRVAGGAQIMDEHGVFNIGQRNCLAMKKISGRPECLCTQRKPAVKPRERCALRWPRAASFCGRQKVPRKGNYRARFTACPGGQTPMAFHLMIVDDSPAMRAFIVRVIGLSGLDVTTCMEASNGQEALDLLRANWIDIVLTDVNMPVMNGEQFLRCMEEDQMLRTIPVLVVSTDASKHRIERMMSLGAKGYLTKPFSPELLRESMEQLLGVSND